MNCLGKTKETCLAFVGIDQLLLLCYIDLQTEQSSLLLILSWTSGWTAMAFCAE